MKKKKIIKAVFAFAGLVVSIYMLSTYTFPTPPAVSGLGFLFLALGQIISLCPGCKKKCSSKSCDK